MHKCSCAFAFAFAFEALCAILAPEERLKISIFDNLHVHVVINGVFSVSRILWRVAGISIKHSLFEDFQR